MARPAQYGRIFNKIQNKPVLIQLPKLRLTLGIPTFFFGVGLILFGIFIAQALSGWFMFAWLLFSIALIYALNWVFNKIDPMRNLTEETSLAVIFGALTRRGRDSLNEER